MKNGSNPVFTDVIVKRVWVASLADEQIDNL